MFPFRCFYNCMHPTEPHILLVLKWLDPEVVAVSDRLLACLLLFSFPVLEWASCLGTAKSTSSIRIIWSHEEAASMDRFSFLFIHPDFTIVMLSMIGLPLVPPGIAQLSFFLVTQTKIWGIVAQKSWWQGLSSSDWGHRLCMVCFLIICMLLSMYCSSHVGKESIRIARIQAKDYVFYFLIKTRWRKEMKSISW